MLEKYRKYLIRKRLRKDALAFSEIISRYNLHLLMRNSFGDVAALQSTDDFKQIFAKHNHLDGNVIDILRRMVKAEKKFSVCIDVGANYGLASVFLAKHSRKVFAFEPEPKNISRLEENVELNALSNVEVVRVALSNKPGTAKFYTSEASSHHSLGLAHPILNEENFIEVKTTTLDSFCVDHQITEIDVLKVDTEGFELEVLQGAGSLLREKRIKNLIFEISKGVMERLGRNPKELTDYLFDLGYKISTPDEIFVSSRQLENIQFQDFVAVPAQL